MINSVPANFINQNKAAAPASHLVPFKNGNSKLSIFYINDMHGSIDNMSGVMAASDKFDEQAAQKGNVDVLKLSAGDNFSGGDEKKNQLVINLLQRMGIDYSAVGNHEFDSTIDTFYKFLSPKSTKFLAANAKTPQGSNFYNNVQKSEIVEINGTKYGLIGLMPFDLETVTGGDEKKLNGIRPEDINNSINIVNQEAEKLTAQGVNRIILLSHIGNDKDKQIASKLHGVDAIVGGHSHTEVENVKAGENLFKNADGNPIVIVQTGENAKNAGILNIEFDEKGIPVSVENNLVKTLQEKSPLLSYIKDATLGKSPEVAVIKEIDPKPDNKRTTPCAWTNLMCDAMRSEANVDIAFINAANTRVLPKAGRITERDIGDSSPLKNTLLTKKMTEKEVVRAIKDALSMTFSNETGEPGILHASGLSYIADTNGNLQELSFVDKAGNKTPINIDNPSDKVYSVCYDSFVAKGTEYPVFVPETMTYKEIDKTYNFDKDKFLIDYLKKQPDKNLTIQDDHRITILDNGKPLLAINNAKKDDDIQARQAVVQNTLMAYSPLLISYIKKLSSSAAVSGYQGR